MNLYVSYCPCGSLTLTGLLVLGGGKVRKGKGRGNCLTEAEKGCSKFADASGGSQLGEK